MNRNNCLKDIDNFVSTKAEKVLSSLKKVAHSEVTLCQRSDAVLRGLDLVLEHHGAPSLIREELRKQLHSYLDICKDEKMWLDRAKFALTYPLSKYLRNPLPPSPDKAFKPTGSLRGWMKARLNAFNRKNTHLWYSWLQCKRSSLPASSHIILATYEKHLSTLTQRDKGDDETIDRIFDMPIFRRLLEKIKNDVTQTLQTDFTKLSASGSACFEKPRSKSGQWGKLSLDVCEDHDPDSVFSPLMTDLSSMRLLPRVIGKDGVRYNVVAEIRQPCGWENWNSLRNNNLIKDQAFFSSFQNLDCTIQGILEPMKVRVISKGNAFPYYFCKPLQKAMHSSMREMDCFRLIGRPFCPTDMIDLAEMTGPNDSWFSIDYSAATDNLSWKYAGRIFSKIIEDLPPMTKIIAESVLGPHNLYYPDSESRKGKTFKGVMQNGQLMGSILSFPILCLANLGVYLKTTEWSQKGWTDQERLRHVLVNGDDMVYAANPRLWTDHIAVASSVGLEMSVGKAYEHPVYANINSTSVHYDLKQVYNYDRFGCVKNKPTPWQIDFLNTGLFYGQHKVQQGDATSRSLLEPEEFSRLDTLSAAALSEIDLFGRSEEECEELIQHAYKRAAKNDESFEMNLRANLLGPGSPEMNYLVGEKNFWNTSLCEFPTFQKLLKRASVNTLDTYENLVSCLNKVLSGALPGRKSDLLKKFLSVHAQNLKLETLGIMKKGNRLSLFTRNLFIPIALGGFGVELPKGFKTTVTEVQKSVAYACIRQLSKESVVPLTDQAPLPGYSINECETLCNVPWRRKVSEHTIYDVQAPTTSGFRLKRSKVLLFQAIPYAQNPSYFDLK